MLFCLICNMLSVYLGEVFQVVIRHDGYSIAAEKNKAKTGARWVLVTHSYSVSFSCWCCQLFRNVCRTCFCIQPHLLSLLETDVTLKYAQANLPDFHVFMVVLISMLMCFVIFVTCIFIPVV